MIVIYLHIAHTTVAQPTAHSRAVIMFSAKQRTNQPASQPNQPTHSGASNWI